MTLFHFIRPFRLLLVALCLSLGPAVASSFAQAEDEAEDPENAYGTGAGLEILLTNNGFGLGAYYSRQVNATASFLLEASLGAGKDERELKFFQFGSGFIPNKRNYLLMLPIQLGFQRRLFADTIEDNFRPYLHVTAGPTLGWEYPYFDDKNGNDRYDDDDIDRRYDVFSSLPKGHFRLGVGGTVALGAYFGFSRKLTQGIRFGYTFHYFFQGIELLEPDVREAQNFFRTPVISITFGRLF